MPSRSEELGLLLDQVYEKFHQPDFLKSDPLEFPHQYEDPFDQEAVALLSALMAYGKVKQIRISIHLLLSRIQKTGLSPSGFVRELSRSANDRRERQVGWAEQAFLGFVHRFNRGEDFLLLLELLGRSWREYGSLGAHFTQYLDPAAGNFSVALDSLLLDWRDWAGARGKKGGFPYLLTAPSDGSCCKRWCMFLRWMGRGPDRMDLGLWGVGGTGGDNALRSTLQVDRLLRTDQLVIPLDTHTGRISQALGLTSRRSLNWKAAVEVTNSLKKIDPQDPVRFDFALARLGILDLYKKSDFVPASPRRPSR